MEWTISELVEAVTIRRITVTTYVPLTDDDVRLLDQAEHAYRDGGDAAITRLLQAYNDVPAAEHPRLLASS